jgi:4-diphosphocytidyl-2-C-methyl-D-erythritol kinase
MTTLRCLAPAKVNVCLFVGRARRDGYHPLVSLVQPLSLADELVLEPSDSGGDEVVCHGIEGENLAARALDAFRAATRWHGPPVRLTITKRVPVAAGMGGGSADAAAALRLAAAASGHDDPGLLHELAIALGADVPSQLEPERCLMTGIGEHIRLLGDPPPFGVVVVPSPHALSTPDVYAEFDRLGLGRDGDELDRLSGQVPGAARECSLLAERLLHNDLEAPARSLCPAIGDALAAVRSAGAVRAMVSGSGPTVVGLFLGEDGPAHARSAAATLAERHAGVVAAEPVGRTFAAPQPG